MDNLKITIIDDAGKYHTEKDTTPGACAVLGELNLGYDLMPMPENDALKKLCESLLALFPTDPVKLKISYSISNH